MMDPAVACLEGNESYHAKQWIDRRGRSVTSFTAYNAKVRKMMRNECMKVTFKMLSPIGVTDYIHFDALIWHAALEEQLGPAFWNQTGEEKYDLLLPLWYVTQTFTRPGVLHKKTGKPLLITKKYYASSVGQYEKGFVEGVTAWRKRCLSESTPIYALVNKQPRCGPIRDIFYKNNVIHLPSFEHGRFIWAKINEWTRIGPEKGVEIETADGSTLKVTLDHQIPVTNTRFKNFKLKAGKDLKIGERLLRLCTFDLPKGDNSPLYSQDAGFLVGVYLAEGCLLKTRGKVWGVAFAFNTTEKDFYDKTQKIIGGFFGEKNQLEIKGNTVRLYCYSQFLLAFIRKFVHGDDAHTKHLTNNVWRHGFHFLKGLFEGFLKGDGYNDAKNERWRITLAFNPQLRQQLHVIGKILGYSVRSHVAFKKYQNGRSKVVDFTIKPLDSTKRLNKRRLHGLLENVTITKIKPTKPLYYYAFNIENKLFADAFGIISHNCDFPPELGKIDLKRGLFKAYDTPLTYVSAPELTFYAVGNKAEVKRLLENHISHVGKKRSQGFGEIGEITVESFQHDWSIIRDNVLQRPIPVDGCPYKFAEPIEAYYAYRPPYWRVGNLCPCFMPGSRLSLKSCDQTSDNRAKEG